MAKLRSRLVSTLLLFSILLLMGCTTMMPKAGDCVDVTKYGHINTPRYCKINGNIQQLPGGWGWSFDLDNSCKFYVCETCTEGCLPDLSDCHNGHWAILTGSNTIDGKIVADSYCRN